MRKMYKKPESETVPVEPVGVICSSPEGPRNVEVNDEKVNNVEIF